MAKKGNFLSRLFYDDENTAPEGGEKTGAEASEDINVSNSGDEITTEGDSIPASVSLDIPESGDGVFDKKFADALNELLEENNIPGVDYLELRNALKGMGSVAAMDESVALKSAFATLKAVDPNLTPEKLTDSIDFYLGLFTEEEKEFEGAMQAQIDQKVTALRNEADGKLEENKQILQRIQELNDQMSTNNKEAADLNNTAAHAEINITQTHKNFVATITALRSKMTTDKDKISSSLNEAGTTTEETKA
jgi:hypothetical protein